MYGCRAAVSAVAVAAAAAAADPYGQGLLTRNGAAVLFGLLAVVVSLVISVRIGRGLVGELLGLRNSALDLAGSRLPAAMRRLRAGEEIDIDAEAPVVEAGEDEIGQVGEALNSVQRAALQAAVERAEVLSGVSGVFVNLARRSQVLVHRQLTLLDQMERRTEDPAELEDLFRLDHLTTRMRRHAEGLIILSGAAPGRAWRKPVPLLDVVRSAVAEVEDYARVEVRRLPRVAVVGAAVADLTHLIAELVENATAFSPPHTRVLVTGEQVGTGYAIEIEDRGLGMGKEAIAEANRRIADAQQADLFDSDRLGLFVVSRLARRHDVKVSLRTSAYRGTTAVLLLPNAVLDTGRGALPATAAEGPGAESVDASFGPHFRAQFAAQEVPLPPVPVGAAPVAVPTSPPAFVAVAEPEPRVRTLRTEPQQPEPPAAEPPRPATPLHPAPAGAGEELPRRVRQASLAVQLRDVPEIGADQPPGGAAERSPEQVRATMTALAEGWARGRGGTAPRHLRLQREHDLPQD
ncbi:ATP-binding protein [Streptacidiphilus monticola]